jgi:hypothetical protein
MRHIYKDKVLLLLDSLLKNAFVLKSLSDQNKPVEILWMEFEKLSGKYDELDKTLPNFITESELGRDIYFIKLYLQKGQHENCKGDIAKICDKDLEQYKLDYIKFIDAKFMDAEFAKSILNLIDSKNYDSAIRKGFLVLTERLRAKFKISSDRDGQDLINAIFGKKGVQFLKLQDDKKNAYRDFFAGIYGIFRNEYAHSLKIPEDVEAEYILDLINLALLKIEEIEY